MFEGYVIGEGERVIKREKVEVRELLTEDMQGVRPCPSDLCFPRDTEGLILTLTNE